MKYIVLFVMALLTVTAAFAEDAENEICSYIITEQGVSEGKFVPGFIPYSNEVFIAYHQEEKIGHIIIEDKEITSIGCTDTDKKETYTIVVKDLQTVIDVFEANNTADVFNEKLSSKDIDVKGATFTKNVKLFFTKIGVRLASWFT